MHIAYNPDGLHILLQHSSAFNKTATTTDSLPFFFFSFAIREFLAQLDSRTNLGSAA